MSYAFERVPQPDTLAFIGTAEQVIVNMPSAPVVGPALVVRAAMEKRYQTPWERIQTIQHAPDFALECYKNGFPENESRRELLVRALGSQAIKQGEDKLTLQASVPHLSREGAQRIAERTTGPLLMVPMAYGGVRAALQTITYFVNNYQQPGSLESVVYPIRFSMKKAHDERPSILKEEVEYLDELRQGRTVWIYDEVAETGGTLVGAARFLKAALPRVDIFGAVNLDARNSDQTGQQGRHWEHC